MSRLQNSCGQVFRKGILKVTHPHGDSTVAVLVRPAVVARFRGLLQSWHSRRSASLVAVHDWRVRSYWPVEPVTTAATLSCPTWVEHAADAVLNGTYAAAVFPGG